MTSTKTANIGRDEDQTPVRSTEFAKVPPHQLADNPRNPSRRIEDLDDMANVAEYGILQPILVATRQNFLRNNPTLANDIGNAPYVIMAGHRRKAAALRHGLKTVPVHIRHDLSANGGDAIVRLLENKNRMELDPISEALEYQRLHDENGMSLRQIADRLHIPSHAVVSKRLMLLKLPTALQEAIASKEMGVTDAEALAKQLDNSELQVQVWRLMQDSRMSVGQAIAEVQRRQHRPPKHKRGIDDPESHRDAAHNSAEARFTACLRLAQQGPRTDEEMQVVARYVLQGASSHRDAVRLAHRWLQSAGVGPPGIADPARYLAAVDSADVVHVAFVIAVASDEVRIRNLRRPWDQRDITHLRRLEAVGHVLTDWERHRSAGIDGS